MSRTGLVPPVTALCLISGLFAACMGGKTNDDGTPHPGVAATVKVPEVVKVPAPADVASAPADAEETPSGLKSKVLQPGTSPDHPREQDNLEVSYVVWKKDGQMVDRTTQASAVTLAQVFPGFREGLTLMTPGEKRRLWVPSKLAYGDVPKGSLPAGDLTVDAELVKLVKVGEPPPVPSDLTKAPADAITTKSGLVYRVLTPGTGRTPGEHDRVQVNQSGFMTDGTLVDTTTDRGLPKTFQVDKLMPGLREGYLLMKEGEKVQFWIPPSLAYGDVAAKPGAPHGTLVFVTELVRIKDSPRR